MSKNTLHKKCPKCKRKRTFTVPPDHQFSCGRVWEKRDGSWVCYWCIARETPDGEAKLRLYQKESREIRKRLNKEYAYA